MENRRFLGNWLEQHHALTRVKPSGFIAPEKRPTAGCCGGLPKATGLYSRIGGRQKRTPQSLPSIVQFLSENGKELKLKPAPWPVTDE